MEQKAKDRDLVLKRERGFKEIGKKDVLKNHRLCTLQSIYDQVPQFRDPYTNKRCQNSIENINLAMNTTRYILSALY